MRTTVNQSNMSAYREVKRRTLVLGTRFLVPILSFAILVNLFTFTTTIPVAKAAVTRQLPFSASLRYSNNFLVADGNYQLTFRIYTVATGGTPVWEEIQTVSVASGILSANLGSVTPLPDSLTFNDGTYYLAVKVDGDDEASPRRLIGAVPIALNAGSVDGVTPGNQANNILKLDSSGNINIQGAIAVGGSITANNTGVDLGSATTPFSNVYTDNLHVNVITLNNPTINGTVSTTGLTLPAYTASGSITGSGSVTISGFTSINGATITGGSLTSNTVNGLGVSSGQIVSGTLSGTTSVNGSIVGSSLPTLSGFGAINGATLTGGSLGTTAVNGVTITGGVIGSVGSGASYQGTAIGAAYGGTGFSSYTPGDLLYAATSSTLGRLAKSSTVGDVLSIDTDGSIQWKPATGGGSVQSVSSGDSSLTVANGTSNADARVNPAHSNSFTASQSIALSSGSTALTLSAASNSATASVLQFGSTALSSGSTSGTLIGSNPAAFSGNFIDFQVANSSVFKVSNTGVVSAASFNAATFNGGSLSATAVNGVDVASGVIGPTATYQGSTVAVQYGGTGAISLTSKGVLYGNGTSAIAATAAGTNGQILVGVSAGAPAFATLSGDATISSSGVLTLANSGVTAGTYGNSTTVPQITVDAKGRITSETDVAISVSPTGAAGGDLSGTYPNPTVAKINGAKLGTTTATSGNLLIAGGAATGWVSQTLSGDATISASGVLTLANATGQNLTTSSTPSFAGLTLTNATSLTVGVPGPSGTTGSIVFDNATNAHTITVSAGSPSLDRTATIPGLTGNDTFAFLAQTQTLTNKTINAGTNTISNLTNSNLSGSAGITNANLANSSVTITTSTGLSGGGTVSLGNSLTLTNTGVTSAAGTANQVLVNSGTTAVTGAITLSLPQSIGISSTPTFASQTLTAANALTLGTAGPTGNTGAIVFKNATNSFTTTLQTGVPAASFTLTLPNSKGNNGDCLTGDGNGAISFSSCTAGAVTSVDTLQGALTIANSSGSGSTITIDNASTSAKGIASFNSTNFSVSSGAVNTIQDIAIGSSPNFAGLTLGTASTTEGQLVFDHLASANTTTLKASNPGASITLTLPGDTGSNGQCLLTDGSGNLSFSGCTGGTGGGVTSVNGVVGILTLNNATGNAGAHTVTIDNASTSAKGIASFNSTNFSVSSGAVNTVQDIASSASPSFAGLTLSGALSLTPTTNQIVLGTTNTTTISSTAPSASRTATIPALAASDTFAFLNQTQTLTHKTLDTTNKLADSTDTSKLVAFDLSGLTTATTRTLTVADLSGTLATLNGGQTFTSATWNGSTITVAYGGTGATTLTANGVLYGNGTSAVAATGAGTNGQILVANTSAAPAFVTVSGDASLSAAGSLTLANTAVTPGTYGDSSNVAQFTVDSKGRVTAASNVAITAAPSGSAGGDLSGTYPNPTVAKINGAKLGTTTATSGNLLIAGGAATGWVSQTLSGAATINASGVLTLANATGQNLTTTSTPSFAGLTLTNATSLTLGVPGPTGTTGSIVFDNATNANTTTVTAGAPSANRTATIPALSADDTFVFLAQTQTLTNKTLTAPTINGTVATTGLTLPAFTASGNITAQGNLTGLTGLTVASGGETITNGGLTVSAGGASVSGGFTVADSGATINGGLNNTSGGITNTGSIAGATTIAANNTVTFSKGGGVALTATGSPQTGASADALVRLGGTALSSGSTNGTYIGANPGSFTGDFINLEVANTSVFQVTAGGAITAGSTINGLSVASGTITGGTLSGGTLSGTTTVSGSLSGSSTPTITGFGTINGATIASTAFNSVTLSGGVIGSAGSGATYNGAKIAEAYGGTNQSTYAKGDLLYASAANTLSKLAAGTDGFVLTLQSGVPAWVTASTGVTSVSSGDSTLTVTNGTTTPDVRLNLAHSNTFTVAQTISASGSAANPYAFALTGTPYSSTGAAATSLFQLGPNAISGGSANGTFIGINPTAFSGNFVDYQVNNADKFKVDSSGNITIATGSTFNGATITSTTFNTATISGGTLSGGSVSGGTLSGSTLSATSLSFSGASGAISNATTNANLTVDANGSGTVSIAGTSTGDVLLGGGSSSTGCTVTNSSGAFACSSTINGATISGSDTLSATALTFSGANPTISPSTTNTGLTLQANGSGTLTVGVSTNALSIASTGLNVSTAGALTGVASIDTITTSSTALTFAGAGTLASTGSNPLTLQAGNGITKLLTSSTQGKLQVYASDGSSYAQLTHDGTNAILSSSTGELQLSGGAGTSQFVLGDVGTAVNLVFQENSTIQGASGGRTITLGSSGDTFNLNTTGATYNIGSLASTGATLTTSSTGTTALTVNGPTSLSANLLDLQVNGTSKANVSAAGLLTLASNISFSGATPTITASTSNTTLTINSNGTGALTLDSGSTGTVNLGTSNNAKTVNVGNGTAGNTINIATGNITAVTDTINIGTGTVTTSGGKAITIGSTSQASAVTLQGGTGNIAVTGAAATAYTIGATSTTGTITVGQSTDTNTVAIASGATPNGKTQTVTIANNATGGGVANVTIGSTSGASVLTLQAGTGSTTLSATGTGTITIGGASQTGTITLGQSTSANTVAVATGAISSGTQTVNIGNGATSSGIDAVTIGSTNSTSSTTIQGGTGSTAINLTTGSGGTINLNGAGGTTNIATTQATVTMFGATVTTFNLLNGNTAATLNLASGTGGNTINIGNGAATASQTINIGAGAATSGTQQITIGSTYANSNVTIKTGSSGGITLGDGGSTNYAKFDSNGALTFAGAARPYAEITLLPQDAVLPASLPSSAACSISTDTKGSDGTNPIGYKTVDCDGTNKDSFWQFKMPTNYVNSSNVQVDVYWTSDATANAATVDVGYVGVPDTGSWTSAAISNTSGSSKTTNGAGKINTSTVTISAPSLSADQITDIRTRVSASTLSGGSTNKVSIVKIRLRIQVGS